MMLRFKLMSKLGLVEPLVRWQRDIELGKSPRPRERQGQSAPRVAVRRAA
jgi:hypothetical protein